MRNLQSQLTRAAALYEKIGWPEFAIDLELHYCTVTKWCVCLCFVNDKEERREWPIRNITNHEAAALIEKDLRERLVSVGCTITTWKLTTIIRDADSMIVASNTDELTALIDAAEKVLVTK